MTPSARVTFYLDSAFLAALFNCWVVFTLCFFANFRFLKNLGSIWKREAGLVKRSGYVMLHVFKPEY